jgi:hypothetical protein
MLCLEFLFDILLLEKQNILISIYYRSLNNEYQTSTLSGRRTIGSFLWNQEVDTEPTTISKSHHIYWFFNKYSLQVTYVAMPLTDSGRKKWFWWYLIQSKSCIAGLRKFHMLHVRCWDTWLDWTHRTLFTCPHMHDKSNDILDNSFVVPTSQKMQLNGAGTIEGMVHTFHWDTALYIYKMHRSNLQR